MDNDIGDQPVLGVVYDQPTGDLYVGTDYGVMRLADGSTTWTLASFGLPPVAVYDVDLKDNPDVSGGRILSAGTHGRGIWQLALKPVS